MTVEHLNIKALPKNSLESLVHRYRYARAAHFAHGKVLDAACGFGYGSKILLKSKNVTSVTGYDISDTALYHAKIQYPNISFLKKNLSVDEIGSFDTIVSLETIEHIENPENFIKKIKNSCKTAIISVPIIPTKHFNLFHLNDFTESDILNYFSEEEWKCKYRELQANTYLILVFEKNE